MSTTECSSPDPTRQIQLPLEKKLLYSRPDFRVYITDKDEVFYDYQQEYFDSLPTEARNLITMFDVAQSQPLEHLKPAQRASFLETVGNGIVACFFKDAEGAGQILQRAEEYLHHRNQELAKQPYFVTSFAIIMLMLGCYGMIHSRTSKSTARTSATSTPATSEQKSAPKPGGTKSSLPLATPTASLTPPATNLADWPQGFSWVLAGCIGAYFSLLSRLNVVATDPAAARISHAIDCCSRMIVGSIGGYIAALAVDSGLLFATLTPSSPSVKLNVIFLLSMIAGASERLIPNFIDSIDSQAAAKK